MKTLRLGTRKSALAQAQARWTADQLRQSFPELQIELVLITTSGDEGTAPTDSKGGLKALFTKEIEEALLDKRIDFAVHSLKDMETTLPKGLKLAAVSKREDPRDAWIGKNGVLFDDLPEGSRVGTSAVRRIAMLRQHRTDLEYVPLRGNIDTRLRKLHDPKENLDGIVLAVAGLKRLGRADEITEIFSHVQMIPAACQGALGIETRDNDPEIDAYMRVLNHPESHTAAIAERAFLQGVGGSCKTPVAVYACMEDDLFTITALLSKIEGDSYKTSRDEGSPEDAEKMGRELAKSMLDND
jgi:hydroxymethylbilane synthase